MFSCSDFNYSSSHVIVKTWLPDLSRWEGLAHVGLWWVLSTFGENPTVQEGMKDSKQDQNSALCTGSNLFFALLLSQI